MASFAAPKGMQFVALFSRSSDAELNARIAEKLGIEVVRGSGGRGKAHHVEKGGAQALIRLKRRLTSGKSVVMIADISKSTAREAGEGVILLAKISGRPILPSPMRQPRVDLEEELGQDAINLPFGRACRVPGEPLQVPADAETGR